MSDVSSQPRAATFRDLIYFRHPGLWKTWPFLPVVRRKADGELECGVLYDCWTVARRPGFSATVFLTNIFLLPRTEEAFLALPREAFDSAEDVAAAGWRVD
jgi:hypothetical protein